MEINVSLDLMKKQLGIALSEVIPGILFTPVISTVYTSQISLVII